MSRNFGHCVVNWTVGNSHILPLCFQFEISSPDFKVKGFQTTNWAMKLKSRENINKCVLYFELVKLDSDDEILPFSGQCDVEISSKLGNVFAFYKNFTWEISSNEREYSRRLMPKHSFDILLLHDLHVKCKMLITFANVIEHIEVSSKESMIESSRDLLLLYENGRDADVLLKIDDVNSLHYFKAHKQILCFRNMSLKTFKLAGKDVVTVDRCGRVMEWSNILLFLYSADMKHVLNPPMLSYYEIAVAYNIGPIMSFYKPDELTLQSLIPVEEFFDIFIIPEFLSCSNDTCLESFQQENGTLDTIREICVYPSSFDNKLETCICIKVHGQIAKCIFVEIYAGSGRSKTLLRWFCEKKEDNRIFEKHIFLKREALNLFLRDGILRLYIRLQIVNQNLLN